MQRIIKFLSKNFKWQKIDKLDKILPYYKEAIKTTKKNKINQYTYREICEIVSNSNLYKAYLDIMCNYKTELLYKSEEHGIKHNIRTSFFALIISICENVNLRDLKIVIEATKYHDIGRLNDHTDDDHGKRSSQAIHFLQDEFTNEEFNELKTIITCHSLNDAEFFKMANINNVNNLDKCERLFKILKDADGLDRVRLDYPYINLELIRTNTAKKLIVFAYELYKNIN